MLYQRITPIDSTWSKATYELHISNKECYDRLQVLESEILNHTIQYRQQAIPPLDVNYNNPNEKPKYICWECHKKLPIKYGRFCPNCGIRLRDSLEDEKLKK